MMPGATPMVLHDHGSCEGERGSLTGPMIMQHAERGKQMRFRVL